MSDNIWLSEYLDDLDELGMSGCSSFFEDVVADDGDSKRSILGSSSEEEEDVVTVDDDIHSPEKQQRPDNPGLNMSDNIWLSEYLDDLDKLGIPEEQQRLHYPEHSVLSTHNLVIWEMCDSPPPEEVSSSSNEEEEDVAADDGDSEPTSDSRESTASSVSDKSDRSKTEPIYFKGQLSPRVSRKRRTSAGSSCASVKSEGSLGYINAKKRCSGPDFTYSSSSSSSSSEEDVAADDGDNDTPDFTSSSSSLSSSLEEEDVAADDGDSDATSISKESTASSASFKSDESKDKPMDFKG